MGPVKDLTEHSFLCWELSLMILKVNGPNILAPWFMPIIAAIVMPQALVHTISYGRHPLLPIDIKFGVFVPKQICSRTEEKVGYAFQKANAFCEKEAIRSKQHFDRTARCPNCYLEI